MAKTSLDAATVAEIVKVIKREYEKERQLFKKQKADWRFRNISLLLKNYRKLRAHCDNLDADITEYECATYDPYELELHTLMAQKAKTAKMLKYFECALDLYREQCQAEGDAAERRYKFIDAMYINPFKKSSTNLADYYNVDRSTVSRDIKKATDDLVVISFGIDSFDDLD